MNEKALNNFWTILWPLIFEAFECHVNVAVAHESSRAAAKVAGDLQSLFNNFWKLRPLNVFTKFINFALLFRCRYDLTKLRIDKVAYSQCKAADAMSIFGKQGDGISMQFEGNKAEDLITFWTILSPLNAM
jgi:hypothetical protein